MRWAWPTVGGRLDWAIFGSVAAATLVIGSASGFRFSLAPLIMLLNAVSFMALAGYLAHREMMPRLSALLAMLGWIVAASTIMSHASYVAASAGLPLCDHAFAALDRMLGIDVVGIARGTGEYPWLSEISAFAYGRTAYQLMLACLVLLALGHFARLADTLTVLAIGMAVTLALSSVLPAAGAFVHYGLADGDLGYLKGIEAGVWHLDHFRALRDGSMREFPLADWEGLVTFPSFHTIYTLTAAYALARVPWLAWPTTLFSGLVIFSTLPVGGHHFVDVLAALAIFAATVSYVAGRREAAAAELGQLAARAA